MEYRKSLCDKDFGILGKDEVASSNLAISSIALAEMQVLFLVLWTESPWLCKISAILDDLRLMMTFLSACKSHPGAGNAFEPFVI